MLAAATRPIVPSCKATLARTTRASTSRSLSTTCCLNAEKKRGSVKKAGATTTGTTKPSASSVSSSPSTRSKNPKKKTAADRYALPSKPITLSHYGDVSPTLKATTPKTSAKASPTPAAHRSRPPKHAVSSGSLAQNEYRRVLPFYSKAVLALFTHLDKHAIFWARVIYRYNIFMDKTLARLPSVRLPALPRAVKSISVPTALKRIPLPTMKPPTPGPAPPKESLPLDVQHKVLVKTMLGSAKRMSYAGIPFYIAGLLWWWFMTDLETMKDFRLMQKDKEAVLASKEGNRGPE